MTIKTIPRRATWPTRQPNQESQAMIPDSVVILWGYEDEIPDGYDLTQPMYAASRIVSGVRMYPYIVIGERRVYLGDCGISPERLAEWAPKSRGHK